MKNDTITLSLFSNKQPDGCRVVACTLTGYPSLTHHILSLTIIELKPFRKSSSPLNHLVNQNTSLCFGIHRVQLHPNPKHTQPTHHPNKEKNYFTKMWRKKSGRKEKGQGTVQFGNRNPNQKKFTLPFEEQIKKQIKNKT